LKAATRDVVNGLRRSASLLQLDLNALILSPDAASAANATEDAEVPQVPGSLVLVVVPSVAPPSSPTSVPIMTPSKVEPISPISIMESAQPSDQISFAGDESVSSHASSSILLSSVITAPVMTILEDAAVVESPSSTADPPIVETVPLAEVQLYPGELTTQVELHDDVPHPETLPITLSYPTVIIHDDYLQVPADDHHHLIEKECAHDLTSLQVRDNKLLSTFVPDRNTSNRATLFHFIILIILVILCCFIALHPERSVVAKFSSVTSMFPRIVDITSSSTNGGAFYRYLYDSCVATPNDGLLAAAPVTSIDAVVDLVLP